MYENVRSSLIYRSIKLYKGQLDESAFDTSYDV